MVSRDWLRERRNHGYQHRYSISQSFLLSATVASSSGANISDGHAYNTQTPCLSLIQDPGSTRGQAARRTQGPGVEISEGRVSPESCGSGQQSPGRRGSGHSERAVEDTAQCKHELLDIYHPDNCGHCRGLSDTGSRVRWRQSRVH